jgi:hypothetical protein
MRQVKINFNSKPFTPKPIKVHVAWAQDVEAVLSTTLNPSFFSQAYSSENLPSEVEPIADREFEKINKRYFYD